MDVIDRLSVAMKQLKKLGVEVRLENLNGAISGLCRVGNRQTLLVEVALSSAEQLEIFEQTIFSLRSRLRSVA